MCGSQEAPQDCVQSNAGPADKEASQGEPGAGALLKSVDAVHTFVARARGCTSAAANFLIISIIERDARHKRKFMARGAEVERRLFGFRPR